MNWQEFKIRIKIPFLYVANIVFSKTKIVRFRFWYFSFFLIWWEDYTRKKYYHQNKEPKHETETSLFYIDWSDRICYVFGVTDPKCFNFPSVKWKACIIILFAIKVLFCCQCVLQKWLIASKLAVVEVKTLVWRISGRWCLCVWVSMSVCKFWYLL